MASKRITKESSRGRLRYFALMASVALAVGLLGAAALRTTLQIERATHQAIMDATWSLAKERVERLDRMIIAQDNAVDAYVNVSDLPSIAERWLRTAARETPTVRAVMVLDAVGPQHEVRAYVSRRPGHEDDRFRRMLLSRMIPHMKLDEAPRQQLRHLHRVIDGRSYLVSYWQRTHGGRRSLVVARHYVNKLVAEIMPELYRDSERSSRMNVVDEHGRILFGPPIQTGGPTVGLQFPTTLYRWRVLVALTSAETLKEKAVRQRYVQLGVVGLALMIAIVGVLIIVRVSLQERRLAALKSDFVANVSHELKTPLASVRMFGELLLTGRVSSDEKRTEYLQIIVRESERLSALIDNVLDFAKVERGKEAYAFARHDVAEIGVRVVDLLKYRAERQGIDLSALVEPAPVVADARAVETALVNLIDNALKYAKDTPSIQLRVAPTAEGGAKLTVVDGGEGISVQDRKRIFDRFVRGQGAQQLHVRGSGIGLALVKHIAESHGGHITLESPPEGQPRGASFEITLPAAPPGHRPAQFDA